VMIVFQIVEESVRFQIDQEAAEHAGLRISSQLLKVAIQNGGKHQ
jgi:YfiR/HmsC-like